MGRCGGVKWVFSIHTSYAMHIAQVTRAPSWRIFILFYNVNRFKSIISHLPKTTFTPDTYNNTWWELYRKVYLIHIESSASEILSADENYKHEIGEHKAIAGNFMKCGDVTACDALFWFNEKDRVCVRITAFTFRWLWWWATPKISFSSKLNAYIRISSNTLISIYCWKCAINHIVRYLSVRLSTRGETSVWLCCRVIW